MLDSQMIIPYSNDGIAAAVNHTFDKRANEVGGFVYKDAATNADPALPVHQISGTATDAKATKASRGTRRTSVNLRREIEIIGPDGLTVIVPIVFRIETSIPVGTPLTTVNSVLSEVTGLVNHDCYKRLVRSNET